MELIYQILIYRLMNLFDEKNLSTKIIVIDTITKWLLLLLPLNDNRKIIRMYDNQQL